MSGVVAALAAFGERRPFAGFAFLFLASAATAINAQAPSVIFDAVMQDLGMSAEDTTFIQTIYMACLGASLILMGSLGDEVGKKRLCLIGLAVLMVGELVAASSPNGAVLLVSRAIQGLGMAGFLSTMVALCSALFADRRQKALAFSLFGASVGVSVTVANLVGELCLQYLSWRSVFLVIEPLLAVSFLGIWLLVRDKPSTKDALRFDGAGAVLLGVSVLSLIFALAEGPKYGWLAPRRPMFGLDLKLSGVFWLLVVSATAFGLFNLHQVRRSKRGQYVALDYTLFRTASFSDGILTTILYFAGGLGVMQIWPSVLPRQVESLTPMRLAYIMMGVGVAFTMVSLAASALADRIGSKRVVVLGMIANLVSLAVLIGAVFTAGTISIGLLAGMLIVFGAGYGLVFTKLTYLALAPISSDRASSASGVLLASRQTSAAIGAAILGALVHGAMLQSPDAAGMRASFVLLNGAAAVFIALALVAGLFLREPFAQPAGK